MSGPIGETHLRFWEVGEPPAGKARRNQCKHHPRRSAN